ncbi:MAG: CrcB family protein [Mesorhizobium sp.]|nr:CrcB family protein [Mesorhizobium sp.]MBL8579874.1 CrcB family protein [Mesorhizobium sp.]
MSPLDLVWVGLGGGSGSLLRWSLGRLVGERYTGNFPLGTFVINISGAFVIGFLSVLLEVHWRDRYSTAVAAGLITGVLGGYTTFSSMQLEAVRLNRNGSIHPVFYLTFSVFMGLAAAALGAVIARVIG